MHIYIMGICGTFMGSLALLARELGHRVSGCDANTYPPMSTQLMQAGIDVREGYNPSHLDPAPDVVVIGNAMGRGNPMVEYVLDKGMPYTSGPQWLAEHVLKDRWVLAVSGTHGKTTTSSMLAWILDQVGLAPGFLIGGVPQGFPVSARLGDTPFFVIEADEYDSAFFDKRSKFVHYRPRTLVINNLEFDHADIFRDLQDIQRQFHHLVRTVPGQGLIIAPAEAETVKDTLRMGCWSEHQTFGGSESADLSTELKQADGSHFAVKQFSEAVAEVRWDLTGDHNVNNGLAAILAARHIGVQIRHAADALCRFPGVKRRLEQIASHDGIVVYDDFAHHPTAIASTLAGLRARVGDAPIWACIEPRSNTMKMGVHADTLLQSAELADRVFWADFAGYDWLAEKLATAGERHVHMQSADKLEEALKQARGPLHIVLMSNGGFSGLPARLKTHFSRDPLHV